MTIRVIVLNVPPERWPEAAHRLHSRFDMNAQRLIANEAAGGYDLDSYGGGAGTLLAKPAMVGISGAHVVGPDRLCSPRHVLPFRSRNEGLKCGG